MIVGTTLASLVRGKRLRGMIVIHHLDGRKTLRMIFLHKGYLQNDDSMLVQLTTGFRQDCIESKGALVMVQKKGGKSVRRRQQQQCYT